MNGASSFKTLGVKLSGPAALVGFSLLRSFSTPDTVRHTQYPLSATAFRKGLSCETQLIEFVDDITRNIDAGKQKMTA
jgi:hypothetical protein